MRLVVLNLVLLVGLDGRSETPTPIEIKRLVRQLGSESFSVREVASKALEAIGKPALRDLREAARNSSNEEVCRRASQLIEAIEAKFYQQVRCLVGHEGRICGVALSS